MLASRFASQLAQPASSLRPGWIRGERTLNDEDVYGIVRRFLTSTNLSAQHSLAAARAELHYIGKTNLALEIS